MAKTTNQLVEILNAGGSLSLDIKERPFAHILILAEASSKVGSMLWLTNAEARPNKQLIELSKFNVNNNIVFSIGNG